MPYWRKCHTVSCHQPNSFTPGLQSRTMFPFGTLLLYFRLLLISKHGAHSLLSPELQRLPKRVGLASDAHLGRWLVLVLATDSGAMSVDFSHWVMIITFTACLNKKVVVKLLLLLLLWGVLNRWVEALR